MRMTNNTHQSLAFVTGVKNGEPVTEDIRPRETKDIAVNADDPVVKGRILSGAITVDDRTAAKVAKAADNPA